MSQLRHRFRIIIDGTKHEIVTSARDLTAVEDPENANPAESTYRLIHAACIRLGLPEIPTLWHEFADLLDDMEDLEADSVIGEGTSPTQATD
jgi:hypothetical protein